MKVLFGNKFFYDKGGSETVFFQERAQLLNRAVQVVDFSMHDERNHPSDQAEAFVAHRDFNGPAGLLRKLRLAAGFVHSREAVRKATALARKERPDIAHFHNIYHQLTPSIIRPFSRNGAKTVLTLHDLKLACPAYVMVDKNGNICTACKGNRFYKPLTTHCQGSRFRELLLTSEAYYHLWRRSYESVDLFISPSRFFRDMVCQSRIPRSRVRVIPNGIDLTHFELSGTDKGYALYVGRLSREKGIPTLLKAHGKLGTPLPLKVVGTGPEEMRLKKEFPLADYLGHQPWKKVLQLMHCASYLVVPSEWYENCPMVVLEAMAMGKPVIGANIGGIPELVTHQETGLLFTSGNVEDLCNKMEELLATPGLCRRMGKAARARVEAEFTLDRHMDRLLETYNQLLARPA